MTMTTDATTESNEKLAHIASNVLQERADTLSHDANEALEQGDWPKYKRLSQTESAFTAELDRRRDAVEQAKAPEAPKVPSTRAGQVEQVRQDLAEAEADLARFAGLKRPTVGPPELGQSAEEAAEAPNAKEAAFMHAEALRNELELLTQRLPFAEVADDDLAVELEDASIRAEDLKKDAKKFADDGRRAAAAKAERELAETTARLREVMGESAIRNAERTRETGLDQYAAVKALKARQTGLTEWRARVVQLEAEMTSEIKEGDSEHWNVEPLRTASKNVELLQKAIDEQTPLGADEIAPIRAELDSRAPRPRGSWHQMVSLTKEGTGR